MVLPSSVLSSSVPARVASFRASPIGFDVLRTRRETRRLPGAGILLPQLPTRSGDETPSVGDDDAKGSVVSWDGISGAGFVLRHHRNQSAGGTSGSEVRAANTFSAQQR